MQIGNILQRIGITRVSERDVSPRAGSSITIPQRTSGVIGAPEAVRIAGVYRALSILTTAMGQLSIDVERGGVKLDAAQVPSIIYRPNFSQTRREFVESLTLALATTGNAYIRVTSDDRGPLTVEPLNPTECLPVLDPKTGRKVVSWRGKTYTPDQIRHLSFMQIPGSLVGLGPIQAAAAELAAARDVRNYAAAWFTTSGQPAGILSTDQKVTDADLRAMRNAWNYLDSDGNPVDQDANPSRVRAIANGAKYTPLLINPKDAQWIEAQQFNATQIARIFGIPAPLMLAAVEGNAQTYSNVEQEWIAFVRFTLAGYMRTIEDALTEILPRGQTVRFNVEALLRTDTKARYEAHKLAIEMGLYTPEYARRVEGITL